MTEARAQQIRHEEAIHQAARRKRIADTLLLIYAQRLGEAPVAIRRALMAIEDTARLAAALPAGRR